MCGNVKYTPKYIKTLKYLINGSNPIYNNEDAEQNRLKIIECRIEYIPTYRMQNRIDSK